MVARLIHRYGVADLAFPGARDAGLDDVRPGRLALFSLGPRHRDPSARLDEPAGRALRDAAHLELAAPGASFRPSASAALEGPLDLGHLCADGPGWPIGPAVAEIVRHGGVPVLLGGGLEDACDSLEAAFAGGATASARCVVVSASLACARRVCSVAAVGPKLIVGAHDLVPAEDWRLWHRQRGVVITATAFDASDPQGLRDWLRDAEHVRQPTFVLIDMGSVDLGHAAGSVGDNVGGLDPQAFLRVVEVIGSEARLAGVAVVQLDPEGDFRGHSERLGARALLSLLAMADPSRSSWARA